MSQRFTRSSISLIRSDIPLSDEDESEITVENYYIRRLKRNSSRRRRHQSVNNSLNRFSGGSVGDNFSSLTESAHLDSSVQYSLFDRLRGFLWRYIYLTIIQIVNLDVWLLSRINNHGKLKFILFLLLPLLFILAWRLPENNALPMEAVYETSNSIISTIFSILFAVTSFISSTFSSIHSYFIRQEGVFTESEISDCSCLQQLEIFSKISSSLAAWFTKFGENVHSTFETKPAEEPPPRDPHNEETKYFQTSREEMKILVSEVIKDEIKSIKEFFMQKLESENVVDVDRIKKIVKEAIMLYDADKIGQVDYALESGGGSVLGTRCSETYVEKYGKLTIFGVPLWTNSNSPRTAIQPDVQPGRCWAFKGSQGFLVLELSATIYPTGFTLEHIPVSLSPSGSIDSAPKNFSVWGLDSERDSKRYLLGEYVYNIYGDPLQYFAVQIPSDKSYKYIELQVHSNHGNMEYTCLYRFRVHGNRVR